MENNIKKRNPVYDCAKGLGILFVVLGHCCAFGYQFYTKFHVLFFFVFAGLMLKSDSFTCIKTLWQNIYKFWKRYAIPYIVCNSIFLMFYNVFIKYHLVTSDSRVSSGISYIDFNIFITKLIRIFILVASSEQLCGATWFLRSLFYGLLAIAILLYITKKLNKNIVYSILSIGLIVLTLYCHNKFLFLFAQSVLCIIIGDYLKIYINKFASNLYLSLLIGTILMLLLCIFIIKVPILSTVICAILGFIFMLQSSLFFEKYFNRIYIILTYIGQNTLPILCLHFLFFKIVTYLYIIETHSSIILLGTFPSVISVHHPFLLSFLYTFVGISFPILCNEVYIKVKESLLMLSKMRCK